MIVAIFLGIVECATFSCRRLPIDQVESNDFGRKLAPPDIPPRRTRENRSTEHLRRRFGLLTRRHPADDDIRLSDRSDPLALGVCPRTGGNRNRSRNATTASVPSTPQMRQLTIHASRPRDAALRPRVFSLRRLNEKCHVPFTPIPPGTLGLIIAETGPFRLTDGDRIRSSRATRLRSDRIRSHPRSAKPVPRMRWLG